MEDEERRKRPHRNAVDQEIRSQAFHFVIKRQEMTADFDDRQKQLFDQALIAILVANLIPGKIEQALAAARDTTISVFSGQMLAEMRAAPKIEPGNKMQKPLDAPEALTTGRSIPAHSPRAVLLSCTRCHGYSLRLRGSVVQCDDCGNIQPTLFYRNLAVGAFRNTYLQGGSAGECVLCHEDVAFDHLEFIRHSGPEDCYSYTEVWHRKCREKIWASEPINRDVSIRKAPQPTFCNGEEMLDLLRRRAQQVKREGRPTPTTTSIPDFGPYPRRPNLTEAEAAAWWDSKIPKERHLAFRLFAGCEFSEDDTSNCFLVGFGVIGEESATISPHWEWKNIPPKDCAILLRWMQKGWIDFGNTAIGYPQ